MNLQQAINNSIAATSLPVYLLKQLETVNGMNKVYEGRDILYFVGLEMPDQMPVDVVGQSLIFWRDLLNAVFAKVAVPGIVSFFDYFNGLRFADCDQTYVFRNLASDGLQIL